MGEIDGSPTVFIVDDDSSLRRSMRYLIESAGLPVQTFASADEFLDTYDASVSGCILLDIRMPGMNGLELQQRLVERGVQTPVIVVSAHGEVPLAVRAMKAGAVDFLEKPVSDRRLLDRIHAAVAKDHENRQRRADADAFQKRIDRLSPRERQVMELVVEGLTSKQIAERLGSISIKTIESHRARLMKKMQARNVPHLISMMSDNGQRG